MNCQSSTDLQRGHHPQRAMTLIEMIGVLTVIAILAGAIIPAALRILDRLASEKETATLRSLGDALKSGILKSRAIPNPGSWSSWASFVATNAGLDVGSVTNTPRNRARIMMVDYGGWLSTNLPYAQPVSGSPSFPGGARFMMVSTMAGSLPVTNGMNNPTEFAGLWNCADRVVPSTGVWAGWQGKAEDVKVQRIDLTSLFVNLALSTYTSATNGQFSTSGSLPPTNAPYGNGTSGYFLQGTTLQLYSMSSSGIYVLDHTQMLNTDSSFVYENGVWKGSVEGDVKMGSGDITDIVAAFLAATPNPRAANPINNSQQIAVVTNMITYMSNYYYWSTNGFTSALRTSLGLAAKQAAMMSAVQGLYYGANSPTNIPCP
jgi:prepilin-type N-terminal cleavage/methylation domain-containing protein